MLLHEIASCAAPHRMAGCATFSFQRSEVFDAGGAKDQRDAEVVAGTAAQNKYPLKRSPIPKNKKIKNFCHIRTKRRFFCGIITLRKEKREPRVAP